MFLTENDLLDRLKLRVQNAAQIDVAVAWAGDCDALDALVSFANVRILRAIIGIAGNATHPNALRALQKCARLRIHNSDEGLFHPKLYIFRERDTRYCWIGSANLTRGGFGQNNELVFEYEDEEGAASEWFEKCWNSLPDEEFSGQLLDEYELNWSPPAPPPRSPLADGPVIRTIGSQGEFSEYVSDWTSFVAQLVEAELYWSAEWKRQAPITGETDSWLETVSLGQRVVRRDDWDTLSKEDRYILLGRDRYGHLGSMNGAGAANNIFRENTPTNLRIRRVIRKALQPCIDATDKQFPQAACNFIEQVSSLERFGGALATRFLALARPDRAVSVNKGSKTKLAALTGVPESSLAKPPLRTGKSYLDLLHWLEEQAWYSTPQPENPREKLYAGMRAALFDALVYQVQ